MRDSKYPYWMEKRILGGNHAAPQGAGRFVLVDSELEIPLAVDRHGFLDQERAVSVTELPVVPLLQVELRAVALVVKRELVPLRHETRMLYGRGFARLRGRGLRPRVRWTQEPGRRGQNGKHTQAGSEWHRDQFKKPHRSRQMLAALTARPYSTPR